MTFSYMEMGAGSSADSTLPSFPTVSSTSGMLVSNISSCPSTLRLYSKPEWGMEVGISRKLPSLSEGINSFPMAGKVWVNPDHTLVVRTFHPSPSKPLATKPKILLKPIQVTAPKRIKKAGIKRKVTLWFKHQRSIGL